MSMSKKDFITLADAIREHNQYAENVANRANATYPKFTEAHIATLTAFCRSQNPRFMRDRWLDYIAGKCGKNGGKVTA